ncbi:hypothetical protein ABPG75_010510 [Micractinium tetrahymenae]
MRAALLGCLLLLAGAAIAADTAPLGLARITLLGRQGCAKRGLLDVQKCGQGDSLSLWAGSADAWSTWLIQAAPKPLVAPALLQPPLAVGRDSAVGRCPANKLTGHIGCDKKSVWMGGGSRWVLEQGRVTGRCTRTYLGAAKPVAGAVCGPPQLAVYTADNPAALTGCFPGHATVVTADGSTKAMAELRSGDRVQAVDWAGRLTFEEIYYWQHVEPSTVASYATIAVVDASGSQRSLQLSTTHYLPTGQDPSGACAALAAASTAGTAGSLLPSWSVAALHLSWSEHHMMSLPPAVHPGMVSWTLGRNGTAQPACILSVERSVEAGAFSPIVRARGIVVAGVVASPFTRWNPVWGRGLLPASADPLVPALADAALTPVYWTYQLLGPQLAWRINNHRCLALGPGLVANAVVWGPVALLALAAAAAVLAARSRPGSAKARPPLLRRLTQAPRPWRPCQGGRRGSLVIAS